MRCVMVEDTENYFILSPTLRKFPGVDPGFFLGGGALVSCSTSTPINHIVFFLENTSCIRKLQVISGVGGGAHPLYPPPRSAPGFTRLNCFALAINCQKNAKI